MRAIRGACEGAFATEGDARPERERGMLVRDASPLPPKSRAGRNARNGYISEGERRRRTVKRRFEVPIEKGSKTPTFSLFSRLVSWRLFTAEISHCRAHTSPPGLDHRLWARIPPPREATSSSRSPSVEKQRSAPPRAPDLPARSRRVPSAARRHTRSFARSSMSAEDFGQVPEMYSFNQQQPYLGHEGASTPRGRFEGPRTTWTHLFYPRRPRASASASRTRVALCARPPRPA